MTAGARIYRAAMQARRRGLGGKRRGRRRGGGGRGRRAPRLRPQARRPRRSRRAAAAGAPHALTFDDPLLRHSAGAAVPWADDTQPAHHADAVRAVAYSPNGRLFSSGGNDKLVKLWDCSGAPWKCLRTWRLAKRVSAVTFSRDSRWLIIADKYGVVSVVPADEEAAEEVDTRPAAAESDDREPAQLLAHCCSIVTSIVGAAGALLAMSPGGHFIATGDRDFKIRVSIFPEEPLKGAPEIQSYCLGHTSFVSCVVFVAGSSQQPAGLLISGGDDETVRLWDPEVGRPLHVLHLMFERGLHSALQCDMRCAVSAAGGQNIQCMKFTLSIVCDLHQRLWVVAGAVKEIDRDDNVHTPQMEAAAGAKAQLLAAAAIVRVRHIARRADEAAGLCRATSETQVLDGVKREEAATSSSQWRLVDDSEVPGGDGLLLCCQGSCKGGDSITVETTRAGELALRAQLAKRSYSEDEREFRKRNRNDRAAASGTVP
eukprot:SM000115S23939  [mRNA]  locus=s115:398578:402464:+ [translate_table: standard]